MKLRLLPILVLAGMLATACDIGGPSAEIDGQWLLANGTVDGAPLQPIPGTRISLDIDGSTVGGIAACNHYGGELDRDGASVSFGAMTMTEMGCDQPVMALESAYVAALGQVDTATRDGERLRLSGPDVELAFTPVLPIADADPVDTTWALESLIVGDGVSSVMGEAELRLAADGTLSGSTGCRSFDATYRFDGDALRVQDWVIDMSACGDEIAGQDDHVQEVLAQSPTIAVDGDRLTLRAGTRGLDYRVAAP